MKIIELLNKIANGEEVPKIILFNSYKYRFDKIDRVYRNIMGNSTLGTINELDLYLNDEVEIIEKDKKIEKIKNNCSYDDTLTYEEVRRHIVHNFNVLATTINELIDKVNSLENKQ